MTYNSSTPWQLSAIHSIVHSLTLASASRLLLCLRYSGAAVFRAAAAPFLPICSHLHSDLTGTWQQKTYHLWSAWREWFTRSLLSLVLWSFCSLDQTGQRVFCGQFCFLSLLQTIRQPLHLKWLIVWACHWDLLWPYQWLGPLTPCCSMPTESEYFHQYLDCSQQLTECKCKAAGCLSSEYHLKILLLYPSRQLWSNYVVKRRHGHCFARQVPICCFQVNRDFQLIVLSELVHPSELQPSILTIRPEHPEFNSRLWVYFDASDSLLIQKYSSYSMILRHI